LAPPQAYERCASARACSTCSGMPSSTSRPSTLSLTYMDIQCLVSACSHLTILTLDSCRRVRAIARARQAPLEASPPVLPGRTPRRGRIRIAHARVQGPGARRVCPVLSFVCSSPPPALSSCDNEFCGTKASDKAELANLRDLGFLAWLAAATWLQIGSSCLGTGIDRSNPWTFTQLLCLRRLELKDTAAIAAMTRILELTPILKVLMLIMPGNFEVQSMLWRSSSTAPRLAPPTGSGWPSPPRLSPPTGSGGSRHLASGRGVGRGREQGEREETNLLIYPFELKE
jgi:hypothetical protein